MIGKNDMRYQAECRKCHRKLGDAFLQMKEYDRVCTACNMEKFKEVMEKYKKV